MFKWMIKSLFAHKSSLVGSSLGIASAFILVIFFNAVWQGESEQIVAYPNKMKPDVWVMQKGVENMHMAMSFVWDWKAKTIQSMPEVKTVTPILYLNTVVVAGNEKLFAFVVGLINRNKRAGPWKLTQGRTLENAGEIVVPDVFSSLAGLSLGDMIKIADKSFNIVGFSNGTYSSANPVFFVQFSDLEDLLSSFGTYSYLLIDSYDGVDNQLLAQKIRSKIDKVNALTHQEFVANDFALAKQMGVEIIYIMTIICSVLAALIVGYSSYSLVNRQAREIAILKALGCPNIRVFSSVIMQSVIVTLIAFILASLFALLVLPVFPQLVAQISVKVSVGALLELGAIAFLVAIVGAFIPAYKVLGLDPALAYQN